MAEMSLPVISQRDLKTFQIVKTSTGHVYKSTYPTAGSFVFIKVLALNDRSHRDQEAIVSEVENLSRRRSELLVNIVGIFRTPKTVGIVTEWMPHGSLHSLLYQRDLYPALPLSVLLRILADVAAAMSLLHSQRPPIMVQRLKPCNILLDAQYRAKLADFWQSDIQKVSFSTDQEESISLQYLSPQKLQNCGPTPEDDVYSLGIILHEALSRKQPFEKNNPLKLVTEITRGIRPQPSIEDILKETGLHHGQHVNLSQLTRLCWHQNPSMRPTAAECAFRLSNVLQSFPKEEIQRGIDTLSKSKERAEQQSQEQVMEFDSKFLDVGWMTRSHMTRARSVPEESTEDQALRAEAKKEKRSGSSQQDPPQEPAVLEEENAAAGPPGPGTMEDVASPALALGAQEEVEISGSPEASTSSAVPAASSCGGFLRESEGSLRSPNYPFYYPPNCHCSWMLEAGEGRLVQLKVTFLDVGRYGFCLFDWLELKDKNTSRRFCGSVAPTTFISTSNWLQVEFVSDDRIGGTGFLATYRMVDVSQGSCSWDEFLCDGRRCLLLPFLCDGVLDCADQRDEQNCSERRWDCGGSLNSLQGSLFSPNHPEAYPGKTVCRWLISVPDGLIIQIQFHNFSLESEKGCRFNYVEVHDSAGLGIASLLGRFCGYEIPPTLISSAAQMTILFVADEEISEVGFYATYKAFNTTENECGSMGLRCEDGKCLPLQWACDGWPDCSDGKDEQDCLIVPDPEPENPCQPLTVPLCQGLSYSLTVSPNPWVSILEQPKVTKEVRGYEILQELPCFPALRPLLCALLLPSCSPDGGELQPCRSVCLHAMDLCLTQIEQLGLSWPFNCEHLPSQSQQSDCVIP